MIQMLFAALLFSPLVQAQSVDAGLWEATSTFDVIGIQLPPSKGEECVSALEAKDLKNTLNKELKKIGCESTKWDVAGTKVDIGLKCNKSGIEAEGKLSGTVTAKSYNLSGDAEGTFQNLPTQAKIKLKGKWLKACTK